MFYKFSEFRKAIFGYTLSLTAITVLIVRNIQQQTSYSISTNIIKKFVVCTKHDK